MAKVVIPLFYHLDRRIWTDSLTATTELTQIEIGQSNTIDFAVRFCNAGVATQLISPAPVWICAIKAINDFAGLNLLLTTTGVLVGTGSTSVYTFTLLIDSSELRAWLLTVTGITALASFEIRDTNNNIATLPALICSIFPDYTLVGTTPTSSSGTLVVASGKTFTISQTLAMPTDNGTAGFVLRTDGNGVGTWVANTTGSVTSVGQSFTGGIIQVSGSPVTASGTLALTILGTQGGIVYFASNSTWASSGAMGQGSLIVGGSAGAPPNPVSAQSAGKVLISNGVTTAPIYSSTITLGASGTLGTIAFGNATSGTILISPPTGALGTPTLTLPITTTTLAGLSVAQTFTAANTFSSTVSLTLNTDATNSAAGGTLTVTGGASVSKKLFVGSLLDIVATTSTAGQITQAGSRLIHTYTPPLANQNIFIGFEAGRTSSMSGGGNVGIGRAVLQSLTSGANNLCFGDGTAFNITSGSSNIIIGQAAGNSMTTGNYNVAVGVSSLGACVSASQTTAVGYQSLGLNTSSNNVGVGMNSGYSSTSANGTYIGHTAGFATAAVGGLSGVAITTGANNTMLGQASSSTSATGTYRTAIGSDSRCQSDNSIKLGRDTLDKVIIPSWATAPTTSLSAGMLYYDTTLAKLRVYTTAWETITSI